MCGPFLDFILPHCLSVYPLCCQCASLLFTALWVKRTGGRAPDSVPRDGHGCSQWGARLAGPHAVCHGGDIKEEWDLHTSEFFKSWLWSQHRVYGVAEPGGQLAPQPVHVGRAAVGRMCDVESQRRPAPLQTLCSPSWLPPPFLAPFSSVLLPAPGPVNVCVHLPESLYLFPLVFHLGSHDFSAESPPQGW